MIIAVSQHLTRGPMDGTISELGITYPVAVDEDRDTWDAYGMRVYPSWAIISAEGELVHRQAGKVTVDLAVELIEQELAKVS
jgi:hypothetical protein